MPLRFPGTPRPSKPKPLNPKKPKPLIPKPGDKLQTPGLGPNIEIVIASVEIVILKTIRVRIIRTVIVLTVVVIKIITIIIKLMNNLPFSGRSSHAAKQSNSNL